MTDLTGKRFGKLIVLGLTEGCLVQVEGVRKERNNPIDALRAARETMKDES